jgi:putative inorganic carbon (hco3(-)) transporter
MLRLIFVSIILIGGFAAMTVNRFAALLLYLWYAIFRPETWIWYDIAGLRLSLIIGAGFVIPAFLTGVFPNVSHALSIGMIGFFITTLLAQFNAVRPDLGWEWIDYLGRLILVCLLAIRLTNTPRRWVMALGVISVSFGFHSATAGLASLMGGGLQLYDGLAGAFVDNNGYALGTVMIIPLLIASAKNTSLVVGTEHRRLAGWLSRGLILAAILSAYTVVSLFSRGGLVALIVMSSVLLLLERKAGAFLLIASLFLLAPLIPVPQGYSERIATIRNYDEIGEKSAISRPHFWRVAVEMAKAHPFFGIGLRNYEAAYDTFDFSDGLYGKGRSVHSSHFQVLAETGLIGSALYVFLFSYGFWVCLRIRSRSKARILKPEWQKFLFATSSALVASMCGFLAGGSFIALAINDLTWLTFFLIVSLDLVSIQLCRKATSQLSSIPPGPTQTRVALYDRARRFVVTALCISIACRGW